MSIVDKLKKYLEETPKEQIQAEWDESKELDNVGPTIEEYSKTLKQLIKQPSHDTRRDI